MTEHFPQSPLAKLFETLQEQITSPSEYELFPGQGHDPLRAIVRGVETETGERFFQSLVQYLAAALGVKYAYISELNPEGTGFRSRAGWGPTGFLPPFEVPPGGPCESVLSQQIIHYADELCALYPKVPVLQEWGAVSYCGVPILDISGNIAGHLAVLDDKPMPNGEIAASIMRIFVARAQAEIERRKLDQTLRKSDVMLRAIDESTASLTGEEFFRSLVRGISESLRVPYAFVSEFLPGKSRVGTLAFWNGHRFMENFEYDLKDTPCEKVLAGAICHYPARIQFLFPNDEALRHLQAESYLAIPLTNQAGKVLGHLAVFDVKPMMSDSRELSIFKIFGARAGAELERIRIESKLRESEKRLARIIDSAMDAIIVLKRDGTVRLLNVAAKQVLRCSEEEILGQPIGRFLSEGFRRVLEEFLQQDPKMMDSKTAQWLPSGLSALRVDGEAFPIEGTLSSVNVSGAYLVTVIVRDINERRKAEARVRRLKGLNLYLQEEIQSTHNFEEVVGNSAALKNVLQHVDRVARIDSTVFITGETGTGKEVIARAVHNRSARKSRPLVKVNCAAIPAGLIESELFGHEKGAFTGALTRKLGRFELAHGGTIFLDEIGELPVDLQPKLLRVLQEGEFERLGSTKTLKIDVRVIAATNRDLPKAVKNGNFRADLFYRLNVFPIPLPPLRERVGDIPLLVKYFVQRYASKIGRVIDSIPDSLLIAFEQYAWPGNIRELEHVVERAVILSEGSELELYDLLPQSGSDQPRKQKVATLEECERAHILTVLERTGWRVSGKNGTAALLGIKPTTLEARMKKLGIRRNQ